MRLIEDAALESAAFSFVTMSVIAESDFRSGGRPAGLPRFVRKIAARPGRDLSNRTSATSDSFGIVMEFLSPG